MCWSRNTNVLTFQMYVCIQRLCGILGETALWLVRDLVPSFNLIKLLFTHL